MLNQKVENDVEEGKVSIFLKSERGEENSKIMSFHNFSSSASRSSLTSSKFYNTSYSSSCEPKARLDSSYASAKPIGVLQDKWKLLPAFLRAKGLVKQHIDSFNYFVNIEIKQIIRTTSNKLIRSEIDPSFFIEFLDIRIGEPLWEEAMVCERLTPMLCRNRDFTYSAPVLVDVKYLRGDTIIKKRNVKIGRLPVMLKSNICILHGKSVEEIQELGECPYDPGGYFIVKGTEKVILMQEQLSKNRIIVEMDSKNNICATVTSTTAESKSRTSVVFKNSKLYLRHNSFNEDIPACIVLKGMGMESDQEIFQMVGTEAHHYEGLSLSIQECHNANVFTQKQALFFMSKFLRTKFSFASKGEEVNSAAQSYVSGGERGEEVDGGINTNIKNETNFIEEAHETLQKVVLPHVGVEEICEGRGDLRAKSRYMCLMLRRALDALIDETLMDDKDYYGNKRVELAGQLISLLFEDLFKRFCSQTKKQADQLLAKYYQSKSVNNGRQKDGTGRREIVGGVRFGGISNGNAASYPDCFRNLPTDIITRGIQAAISTGNWTIKRFKMERLGVAQVLSRLSFIASLGMMTRVSSQFEKGRKVSGPRALQPSQWGLLCPCDTPEGESCGLVKNLALMTQVTSDEETVPIVNLVFSLGVEDAAAITGEELHDKGTYIVFLNGSLLGVHRRPNKFMKNIRCLRRAGRIGEFVSVYANEAHKAIYIASDGGRLCRPIIVVENGVPRLSGNHIRMLDEGKLTFADLLSNGILEWIDVNEENNLLVATRENDITNETTHLEIDALTILGVVAGLIPYPHHNQSPRNTYQCAMGKQAIGVVAYNQFIRCDTLLYLLLYPQKPLCKSRTIDLINFEHLPAGQNANVAVMSYSGYDIEDAIIMNKASIDRGFGRCFAIRRHNVEMKKYYNGTSDRTYPPPPLVQNENKSTTFSSSASFSTFSPPCAAFPGTLSNGTIFSGNINAAKKFSALEEDGVARVGELLQEDKVFVNRFSPINTRTQITDITKVDVSYYKPTPAKYKGSYPSYVDRVVFTENSDGMKIFKILLRQTRLPELGDKFSSRHGQKGVVGLIVEQEDMPFSESGWCPDLIMNPHGFPSRMTVGKIMELIAGKVAVLEGKFTYGTAFGGTNIQDIANILISRGFNYSGKELLTSGITGEPLETYIFAGPIYYQKLKHMVQDKMHARGRGPRQILTRQPTEGRAKEGGLRVGEMERDCLVAYGASNLLIERLLLCSDIFDASICVTCGFLGYKGWCPYCHSHENVANIRMPYACKLLFQELMAMNVFPRLTVTEGA